MFKLDTKNIAFSPYEQIIKYIYSYSENHGYFDNVIISVTVDGVFMNELLLFEDHTYIFYNDWWEGEEDVWFVGFTYLDEVVSSEHDV